MQSLPKNQQSSDIFGSPHLPLLSLANGPLRSDWEALCLDNISVLSAVTALLSPPQAAALAVRYASKKTGGSSKNLGGKSPGKRFGLRKMEGTDVPWLSFPSYALLSASSISLKSRKAMQVPAPILCLAHETFSSD